MIDDGCDPRAFAEWMQLLADATRLRLLRLLSRQELGVGQLCQVLRLPQSTVSRHLKMLAEQQWVGSRRNGTQRLYRMHAGQLHPAARRLWQLAREHSDGWPVVRQDELRLARLQRDRQVDAQAFFAGAAARWDRLRQQLYGQSFTTEALLALLPADWVVADLGCGTGHAAAALADHVGRVVGVDSSPAMLRAARKRLAGRDNVELIRADLNALPLADASCQAALLLLVLTYLPEVQPALTEARRIIAPGGKLVIVDLLAHDRDDFRRQMRQQHMGFDPQQIRQWLARIGLSRVTCSAIAPQANASAPALFLATAVRPNDKEMHT